MCEWDGGCGYVKRYAIYVDVIEAHCYEADIGSD